LRTKIALWFFGGSMSFMGFLPFEDAFDVPGCWNACETEANGRSGFDDGKDVFRRGTALCAADVTTRDDEASGEEASGEGVYEDANADAVIVAILL
jgi:hypothetical protein